jgi:hypothetical protein
MPEKKRHVVKWRRKKLPNGRYLQIAVTKEAGPKGGHTLAYVQTRKGGQVDYPATTGQTRKTGGTRKVRRKHGRQVKVRR